MISHHLRTTPIWPFVSCAHLLIGIGLSVCIFLFTREASDLRGELRNFKEMLTHETSYYNGEQFTPLGK